MKKLILITEYYPYTNNYETFLENEIIYLSKQKDFEVTILPLKIDKVIRNIPNNIKLDNALANKLSDIEDKLNSPKYKLFSMIKSFFDSIFWKELRFIGINTSKSKELLFSLRKLYIYRSYIQNIINDNKNYSLIFYTYWFTEMTHALQLENDNSQYNIVTRTHGYDLYEERTLTNYMPLKRTIVRNLNKIYTITTSANNYLIDKYNLNSETIETSPLGVEDRNIITLPSKLNHLVIVSCSSLIPVKQVTKIIDALKLLSLNNSSIEITWYHLGTGWMEDKIKEYADSTLNNIKNLEYQFLGFFKNKEIYEFYKNSHIDLFINVSKSEGVPVSIMEAMSCQIPIVAPDIGGIRDMIDHNLSGILLKENPSIEEITNSLNNLEFFKNKSIREHSRTKYLDLFNAKINYENFIRSLNEL